VRWRALIIQPLQLGYSELLKADLKPDETRATAKTINGHDVILSDMMGKDKVVVNLTTAFKMARVELPALPVIARTSKATQSDLRNLLKCNKDFLAQIVRALHYYPLGVVPGEMGVRELVSRIAGVREEELPANPDTEPEPPQRQRQRRSAPPVRPPTEEEEIRQVTAKELQDELAKYPLAKRNGSKHCLIARLIRWHNREDEVPTIALSVFLHNKRGVILDSKPQARHDRSNGVLQR